jgi:hypothetical protein
MRKLPTHVPLGPPSGLPIPTDEVRSAVRLILLLQRKGRRGGLLALLAAAALGAPGAVLFRVFGPFNGEEAWSPAGTVISLLLLALALLAGGVGMRQLVWPAPVAPPVSREGFLALLDAHAKPVRACLGCRTVLAGYAGAECPQCFTARDCFEVTSDADVRVVRAALR